LVLEDEMIRWKIEGKCSSYAHVPRSAKITEVNGREVMGFCECCEKILLDGAKYHTWEDGVLMCPKCHQKS
jgi:hypothetical protein